MIQSNLFRLSEWVKNNTMKSIFYLNEFEKMQRSLLLYIEMSINELFILLMTLLWL